MSITNRLQGKRAIITGGSRGIGLAIAQRLIAEGARVVITGRSQESLDTVVAQVNAPEGTLLGIPAHMGETDQIKMLVQKTVEAFGGIDIIVNNAATNPAFGPILQSDHGIFDKIMNVNVRGPYDLMLAAQPYLADGGGSIINLSSVGGLSPEPMLGLYSVSKAALLSLTKVIAQEWGAANIRANTVCPGLIKTKFSSALWANEAILKQVTSDLPLGRAAEPDEVAGLIAFLASDDASYCTGGTYTVDGGHSL